MQKCGRKETYLVLKDDLLAPRLHEPRVDEVPQPDGPVLLVVVLLLLLERVRDLQRVHVEAVVAAVAEGVVAVVVERLHDLQPALAFGLLGRKRRSTSVRR